MTMTSQERTGTLKLKKGGELSGTITESYNGDINITTYEGDMFVFQEKEVSKIIYDKVKTTKVSKHTFKGTLETSRISPKLKIEAPDKRWEHEITIAPFCADIYTTDPNVNFGGGIEYFANFRVKPWLILGVGSGFGVQQELTKTYRHYFEDDKKHYGYNYDSERNQFYKTVYEHIISPYIPILAQIRFEFLRYSKLKPYISIKGGLRFMLNGGYEHCLVSGYAESGVGVIYRINNKIHLELGYELGYPYIFAPHIGTSFAF